MEQDRANVLAVDDSEENLRLLGSALRKNGYAVAIAQSGEEAIGFVKTHPVDAILLDIMMPHLDGYEVCRRLKADIRTRDIPILFLTAKTDQDSLLKGFAAGGVDYLTKPFHMPELLARVGAHVKLKKALEEIRTLRGLIPICAYCHKIRDDSGYWEQVESYIQSRTAAVFSHTICPICEKKHFPQFADEAGPDS